MLLTDLDKIENIFKEEIQKQRESIKNQNRFGDLEKKYMDIIEEIYVKKNAKCIKGEQAK